MEFLKSFFKEAVVKKTLALILLVIILYSMRSILNLLLLTFIFSYLFYGLQKFLFKHIRKVIPIKEKYITIAIYLILILAIVFGLTTSVYHVTKDVKGIRKNINSIQIDNYTDKISSNAGSFLSQANLESYGKPILTNIFHVLPHVSQVSAEFLLAFILSFFLLLGKKEIKNFCSKIEDSKISFLYNYYKYLGVNFANTFGKVLQIQILISFINSVLSMIMLTIIGFHQVLGLGFMMFFLGLVPVAGVVISIIPLAIIGFTIGGMVKVIEVLVMILILHAIETYLLNPRLMSAETKLPIFLAFLTLIIGEHFMGTWGLLLGIPMLMFLLDLFGVKVKDK